MRSINKLLTRLCESSGAVLPSEAMPLVRKAMREAVELQSLVSDMLTAAKDCGLCVHYDECWHDYDPEKKLLPEMS